MILSNGIRKYKFTGQPDNKISSFAIVRGWIWASFACPKSYFIAENYASC